jgi:hypothetical protein
MGRTGLIIDVSRDTTTAVTNKDEINLKFGAKTVMQGTKLSA